jgi:hypothetical protein
LGQRRVVVAEIIRRDRHHDGAGETAVRAVPFAAEREEARG